MTLEPTLRCPLILIFTYKLYEQLQYQFKKTILIEIDGVVLIDFSVSLLNNTFLQYDTKIIFPYSSDTSIHI